jgi:transposase
MKKYKITLTQEERTELNNVINKGKVSARKRIHAQILLRADEGKGQDGWKDVDVAKAYGVSLRTVERIRERFVTEGFAAALQPKAEQEHRARKFDGEKEAKLITLACGKPPEGRARWTLQLLADAMVRLNYMESISHQGVRNVLKKTNLSLG